MVWYSHGRAMVELHVWLPRCRYSHGVAMCMCMHLLAAGFRLAAGQARRAAGDLRAALPAGEPPRVRGAPETTAPTC
eukprot:scaffold37673_cov67-Phaeocystis_antarctica.AAC.2